jgi:putative peptidoglycan lipid II flippase
VLPSFSTLAARKDHALLKETYVFALRMAMFVIIPAMIGLIVLRVPVTQVLFERGSFTHEATLKTAVAVLYYALGLWTIAGVRVTVPVYYALHDTKTPVKVGVISLIATVAFSLLLMGPLQHGGLALAVSLSSAVNLALLLVLLRKKIGALGLKAALRSGGKVLLASLGMAAFCLVFLVRTGWLTGETGGTLVFHLGAVIGGSALVFLALSWLLRCPEVGYLKEFLQRRTAPPLTSREE